MAELDALPERFRTKVDRQESGCWIWTAALRGGYGRFKYEDRIVSAHRLSYELLVGPIPEGLELDHLCRTPACVNPAHLEPVTHAENFARGLGLGPALEAWKARTHCPAGHEYTESNTYRSPRRGERRCMRCNRDRQRALRARKRLIRAA